jgi:hypothetical protein
VRQIIRLPILALGLIAVAASAQTVRSGTGLGVTLARDQFRADLGSARREINWDGVPDSSAAPANLPADFFNTSPRGAVFSTPGSGFQVSAGAFNPNGTPIDFANINFTYSGLFEPFSPQRLFTPIGSNVMDVSFFLSGTTAPALVRGFGAVFSDVDLPSTTFISFFDSSNTLLASFAAPHLAGNQTLSFIGASFDTPLISRVRIIAGNVPLAAGTTELNGNDLVVMDDFIFGEPVAVPEPATWAMMIAGFGLIGAAARSRSTATRARSAA